MSQAARFITAEELEKFQDDDHRYELVEGRVVRMSPVGYQHGRVVGRVMVLLGHYVQSRDLGVVLTEVGFTLAWNPDIVRAPDIAFIRRDRIPANDPRGFWKGPPDLAIEVISPGDRPSDIRAKVDEYLERGVPLVLVVDPDQKSVTTFRPSRSPAILRAGEDVLTLDDVVTGFHCRLQEIFG